MSYSNRYFARKLVEKIPVAIRQHWDGEIVAVSMIIDTELPRNASLHLKRNDYCYVDGGIFKSILGQSPSGVWVLSMIETSEFQTLKAFGVLDITSEVDNLYKR